MSRFERGVAEVSTRPSIRIAVHPSIEDIDAAEWNGLDRGDQPFLRHEFFAALAAHGAVGGRSGWHPRYLAACCGDRLVGALPLFIKDHSFGEFVFDWAWADAYERGGLAYYPKLVVAIPYTPVTGHRLLLADSPLRAEATRGLIEGAIGQARDIGASSLHWLFTTADETERLRAEGHLVRSGCQFHWENPGYGDFSDFLGTLSSRHRKKMRAERRGIRDQGVEIEVLAGEAISAEAWNAFHRFYVLTYVRKGSRAPLTRGFFSAIGASLGRQVVLIMARDRGEYIAGALFFAGADALYGRNWGAREYHHHLHFELCYYRAMEYCIENGIRRFEAGAQGEYKVQRGFVPRTTHSAHWVANAAFAAAISDFLAREDRALASYMDGLAARLPFKAPE